MVNRRLGLAETVDPLSLNLAMGNKLASGATEFSLNVISENEVRQYSFKAEIAEELETALGCVKSVEVKRIRENSSRYSSGWYAQGLKFVPVKMIHGKQGGDEFELRIKQLIIDGRIFSTKDGNGLCEKRF